MNRTMNRTIFRCSLDIHDIYSQFTLPIKKGDTSGRLVITLMENGKPYNIVDGCYAIFAGKKANGAILHNACVVEKNTIIYDISKGTTSTAGKIGGEIILYDEEGQELISPRFTIVVHDSIYSETEVEESGEYLSLINVLSEAKSLIADVESKLKNGEFKGDRGEKGDQGEKGDTGSYAFDGIYNAETNKAATVQTVTDKIAEIVANAPEKLDTLEEISAWIEEHPKDVAEINALISKNATAISTLESNIKNGTVVAGKAKLYHHCLDFSGAGDKTLTGFISFYSYKSTSYTPKELSIEAHRRGGMAVSGSISPTNEVFTAIKMNGSKNGDALNIILRRATNTSFESRIIDIISGVGNTTVTEVL